MVEFATGFVVVGWVWGFVIAVKGFWAVVGLVLARVEGLTAVFFWTGSLRGSTSMGPGGSFLLVLERYSSAGSNVCGSLLGSCFFSVALAGEISSLDRIFLPLT